MTNVLMNQALTRPTPPGTKDREWWVWLIMVICVIVLSILPFAIGIAYAKWQLNKEKKAKLAAQLNAHMDYPNMSAM